MSDLLNTPQRNSLTNVLRAMEERLRQAEAWLNGVEETGLLYHRSLHLSSEQRELARQFIAMALKEINELWREFDLKSAEDDLGATIGAGMSLIWADLYDTYSKKLERFGEVDPRVARVLDPRLDRLIELAQLLASLARSNPSDEQLDHINPEVTD